LAGDTVVVGTTVNITGTAKDFGGGSVVKVEVSVDGGATWNLASGTDSWNYPWTVTSASSGTGVLETISSRATDNSGNRQNPPSEIRVLVVEGTPPTVTSFSPPDRAVDVSQFANVIVTFSELMDSTTVNGSTVELRDPSGDLTSATVSLDPQLQIATLDPAEPLASRATYTAVVKGGNAGVKDLAGNPLADDLMWTFTTIQSPQVLSVTPTPGATNISPRVVPTATFSEALDPATVNSSTVVLTPPTTFSPRRIIYAQSAFRVLLEPNDSLQYGQTYTVTLKGGASGPRITNLAGTPLAADYKWSFTIAPAPPPIPSWSIWAPSDTPSNPITNDMVPTELGLKFRSDSSGLITGVRVYGAGAANLSSYIGHLWTSSGTLLGGFDLPKTPVSGWQQSIFRTPIPIVANTTYVVSYSVPMFNFYSADPGYFESQGRDNGPLHAPKSADAGGNGVIGAFGQFPDQPSMATNYWVDVVFSETGGLAPQVLATSQVPTSIASTDHKPQTRFSKPLDPESVKESTVMLIDQANNLVPANVSYDANTLTVTITPDRLLHFEELYTVVLKGGGAAPHITDLGGTPLANDFTWSFFTVGPPLNPKPILLLTSVSSGNKFAEYCGIILGAEGFSLSSYDIAEATALTLSRHNVIILGEMQLTPADITMLSNWVAAGGNLIAMRPDKQLASLLGISDAAAVRSEAYLKVDTSREPGAGIVGATIQYHGTADLYTLEDGTQQVATIYSGPTETEVTPNPAVTLRSVGTNGGQAAAFAFDLAKSIIYTRQGNPAWAGQDRDGIPPIRTNDLFFGGSEPDWVNLDKIAIPQADELQRLFANMILSMSADRSPIPRFWYLPNMKKAAIMMTGDDHGTPNGTQTVFDMLNAASPLGCSRDNWECYRATSWVYPESGLTNDQARDYFNQGFEVGAHITTNCENWTPETLSASIIASQNAFRTKYVDVDNTRTNRTHCGVWTDWATHPKAELNRSISLDASYYYWPPQWVQNRPGFMTGSGFPMRYADLDGSRITVYQAATHLSNETGASPESINSLLDKALGDEGYYGVFGVGYDYTDQFASTILDIARERNISLISAQQLLTWLVAKSLSSFNSQVINPTDSGFNVEFSINVSSSAHNLMAMIPYEALGGRVTSIKKGDFPSQFPVEFTVETIKGRSYAVFPAVDGSIGITATYTTNP